MTPDQQRRLDEIREHFRFRAELDMQTSEQPRPRADIRHGLWLLSLLDAVVVERDALTAKVERLWKYVKHEDYCPCNGVSMHAKCECGLTDAAKEGA